MCFLRVWLLLALLPLLAGCFPVVYSEQPLGEVAVLKSEEWNGRWLADSGNLFAFSVVDTEVLVTWKDDVCNPSPDTKTVERLKLRQFGSWYIVSKKRNEGDERLVGLYESSVLMRRFRRSLLAYFPDDERTKTLVDQGALPGRIEGGHAILGALTPEHHQVLFSVEKDSDSRAYPRTAKDDAPVVWHPVGIFTKLSDELDPCKKGEQSK